MSEQTEKRAERLKAALRENLRRRKAQARGRSEGPAGGPREATDPGGRDDDPARPHRDDPA